MNTLNIVGLGYIGLPTALMFAANGIEVLGTDLNKELVKSLNEGKLTFEEKGLPELFDKAVKNGIKFSEELLSTNRYIITVPTPYIKENKKIEAKYVINAVKNVLEVCVKGAIIAIESTISPGTIDKFVKPIIKEYGYELGKDVHLAHAPERIIPGNMIYELENNSRTIGADERKVGEEVKSWYKSFCKGDIVVTDIKTAEMSKVVENTYRDINIAFANELAKICNRENINVYELISIANKHPRVNILNPGPGVGGHCISVDPWFLVGDYPDLVNVILASRHVNDEMPDYVIEKMVGIMNENGIKSLNSVGLYGLTYKEDVDDLRESPTLQILERFEKYFAKGVNIYDPMVSENKVDGQTQNFDEFIQKCDMIVVLTAHKHIIENMDSLKDKIVFDTRNVVNNAKKLYKL